jgi:hypothetical protein
MKPSDASSIRDQAYIAEMLPFIQAETDKAIAALETRVFQQLRENTLTPDMALTAWMQKAAHLDVVRRLNTRVRVGTSIAERNLDVLNQGVTNGR